MKQTLVLLAAAAVATTAGLAIAGGHGGNPAVKARQAHMQLYQHNLGILGGMAKGEIDYDAAAAQAAADNLAALTSLNQRSYWAPGTSRDDLGEETRALPAIWAEGSKAGEIGGQLQEAAAELASVAGMDRESLGPALGPVGQACQACHKEYRQSDN